MAIFPGGQNEGGGGDGTVDLTARARANTAIDQSNANKTAIENKVVYQSASLVGNRLTITKSNGSREVIDLPTETGLTQLQVTTLITQQLNSYSTTAQQALITNTAILPVTQAIANKVVFRSAEVNNGVLEITKSDGSVVRVDLPVPEPGRDGRDGRNGTDGEPGRDGRDGTDGENGRAPTSEEIEAALANSEEANPYSYNLKFSHSTDQTARQIASPSTDFNYRDATNTDNFLSIPIIARGTEIPNNVSANIPFMTLWEGTLLARSEGNGKLFLRIRQTFTHFIDTVNEFSNTRELNERALDSYQHTIPLSALNSVVTLPDEVVARFPDTATQAVEMDITIEVFMDSAFTMPVARNALLNDMTFNLQEAGLQFLQSAPILGPKGDKGDKGDPGRDGTGTGTGGTGGGDIQPDPAINLTISNPQTQTFTLPDGVTGMNIRWRRGTTSTGTSFIAWNYPTIYTWNLQAGPIVVTSFPLGTDRYLIDGQDTSNDGALYMALDDRTVSVARGLANIEFEVLSYTTDTGLGEKGEKGDDGQRGQQGLPGAPGDDGTDGTDGATFIPADHDVTELRGITDVGSGRVITLAERNKLEGLSTGGGGTGANNYVTGGEYSNNLISLQREGLSDVGVDLILNEVDFAVTGLPQSTSINLTPKSETRQSIILTDGFGTPLIPAWDALGDGTVNLTLVLTDFFVNGSAPSFISLNLDYDGELNFTFDLTGVQSGVLTTLQTDITFDDYSLITGIRPVVTLTVDYSGSSYTGSIIVSEMNLREESIIKDSVLEIVKPLETKVDSNKGEIDELRGLIPEGTPAAGRSLTDEQVHKLSLISLVTVSDPASEVTQGVVSLGNRMYQIGIPIIQAVSLFYLNASGAFVALGSNLINASNADTFTYTLPVGSEEGIYRIDSHEETVAYNTAMEALSLAKTNEGGITTLHNDLDNIIPINGDVSTEVSDDVVYEQSALSTSLGFTDVSIQNSPSVLTGGIAYGTVPNLANGERTLVSNGTHGLLIQKFNGIYGRTMVPAVPATTRQETVRLATTSGSPNPTIQWGRTSGSADIAFTQNIPDTETLVSFHLDYVVNGVASGSSDVVLGVGGGDTSVAVNPTIATHPQTLSIRFDSAHNIVYVEESGGTSNLQYVATVRGSYNVTVPVDAIPAGSRDQLIAHTNGEARIVCGISYQGNDIILLPQVQGRHDSQVAINTGYDFLALKYDINTDAGLLGLEVTPNTSVTIGNMQELADNTGLPYLGLLEANERHHKKIKLSTQLEVVDADGKPFDVVPSTGGGGGGITASATQPPSDTDGRGTTYGTVQVQRTGIRVFPNRFTLPEGAIGFYLRAVAQEDNPGSSSFLIPKLTLGESMLFPVYTWMIGEGELTDIGATTRAVSGSSVIHPFFLATIGRADNRTVSLFMSISAGREIVMACNEQAVGYRVEAWLY